MDSRNDEESIFDICDGCGREAELTEKVMFDSFRFLPTHDLYCQRCIARMRGYRWIGFSLLGLLLLGFTIAVLVLTFTSPV